MTARGESVTYEVRLEVDEAIHADVDAWLPGHVNEILKLPGFTSAQIYDDAPLPVPADEKVRRTVRYELVSREALTAYLRDHAARMREDGVKRFGERMRATRRVLEAVDAAKPGDIRSCSNCHAPLNGQYCAECGQRDRSRMISLWELITDFAGEFFDLDSRFWRTLFPLVFSPGHLTAEYLRGRRVHYTPPLRLYVISSVVFFLLATLGGVNGDFQIGDKEPETKATQPDNPATPAPEEEGARDEAPPSDQGAEQDEAANPVEPPEPTERGEQAGRAARTEPAVPDVSRMPPEAARAVEEAKKAAHEAHDEGLMIGPEKCTLGDFQTGNSFIDGPVRARLQTACKHIVADKGQSFVRQLVQNIPKMLFFFLPIIALAMKPLYFRSHRYYVEHLLFFVHVHSFVFTVLTITLLSTRLKNMFPGLGLANGLLIAAVSAYIPYYLFRALRVVYGQGRFVTLIKYIALFFVYVIGSSIILVIGALFTALTV